MLTPRGETASLLQRRGDATKIVGPKTVFEIGTLNGYSALHFALNTSADAKIFALDLPRNHAGPLTLATTATDKGIIARRVAIKD